MNLKVRVKNPVFWIQIGLAILAPILTYFGLTEADLTSWKIVGDTLLQAVSNPYVCGMVAVSVWNALNDPTTAGVKDSERALTYDKPAK